MKLTDTHLVLLSAAARRDDHLVDIAAHPRPASARKAAARLIEAGLLEEVDAGPQDPRWRQGEDDRPLALRITAAGLSAIGLGSDEPDEGNPSSPDENSNGGSDEAQPSAPARTPVKPGTKRAILVSLLEKPEGATLARLSEALGWLPHTTRAALTGLRHAGYEVTRSQAEGGGSVYRIPAVADATVEG